MWAHRIFSKTFKAFFRKNLYRGLLELFKNDIFHVQDIKKMPSMVKPPECQAVRHPASSCTGRKKLTMPELVRNANVGVSFFDADALLWPFA
jgi:hypothetical protein